MGKLKIGDRVEIINQRNYIGGGLDKGCVVSVCEIREDNLRVMTEFSIFPFFFEYKDVKLVATKPIVEEQPSPESQSKKIKQALRKICLSGLVIKSEKIIDKVKQDIGTEYVFGDTILRGLRQLRSDGVIDYTADKQTREYTFK